MDRTRAEQLHALLSRVEPEFAEPALQPLERLLDRPTAGSALIVALVGASGVGKSELINMLAGTRVVTAGPLRPTTTEISIWGDVDGGYLPGRRVPGANRPDRVTLVDTPPAEHYPDTVAGLLHRVDAVVFVVSPDRYSDAITAALLETVVERGIPTRIVLSAPSSSSADVDAVVRDAEHRNNMVIEAVVVDDAGPLRAVLGEMAETANRIVEQRDRAAATFAALRAGEVAEALAVQAAISRDLIDRADTAFSAAGIDEADVARVGDLGWSDAAVAIADLARRSTERAINAWEREVAMEGLTPSNGVAPGLWLPEIDPRPIDDWYQTTAETGVRAVRWRRLHPLRSRSVRDQLWRLAIDFDRRPDKRVRKSVGAQLPDLRIDRRSAFVAAIRDARAPRIAAFTSRLDSLDGLDPEEIRETAEALARDASHAPDVVEMGDA